MTCPACAAAETDPRRDEFAAGCLSCAARAMVCVGHCTEPAMRTVFGARVEEGRAMVERWRVALRRHQAGQAARP
jgi:hypothetical protein